MTETDQRATKDKILDAAEERFADEGFGTSLRAITSHAGVNLAAIHYHFGSKEALIEALFKRRLEPLNHERLELLDRLESSPETASSLEKILEAFVGPLLRLYGHEHPCGEPCVIRLFGRILAHPSEDLQRLFMGQFRQIADRFIEAFKRALPDLPEEEVFWRMHFLVGSMAHTMAMPQQLRFISRGLCEMNDVDAAIRRLVEVFAAGMRAPVASGVTGGRS